MPSHRDLSKCPIIVLVGVAGAGKNAVLEGIYNKHPEFVNVDSITTRPLRANDPGRRYLDEKEFLARAEQGEFMDWVKLHGFYYQGKLKADFITILNSGKRVLVEIDYRGVEAYQKIYGDKIGVVFLSISPETQVRRFWSRWEKNNPSALPEARKQAESDLKQRQSSYPVEIKFAQSPLCDWVVSNEIDGPGALDSVIAQVEKIIVG